MNVYIIELEQPFINWFGVLKSYYPSSNFCEIENENEEIIKVRCSEVYEVETMKNIKDVLI